MAIKYVAIALAIVFATANAVPYSKFGRTCQDIGCRSDEVCVMADQPCSYHHQRDQCGSYPTCQRSNSGGESCTTKICPTGQYCRTESGKPTCVNTNAGLAYDSAGVSSVNGQKLAGGQQQPAVPAEPYGTRYANSNPYANANAPPAEDVLGNNRNNYPSNNNNYPSYPANNNNNAYPSYPVNNNNNRPPVDQYGYPVNTNRQLPQLNPGWGNTYPNSVYHRRNGANDNGPSSLVMVLAIGILACLRIIKA